jgi:pilus assembly protein Flp/PilA
VVQLEESLSMSKLIAAARSFVAGEEGATMVEYGLMVALIAAVCIAVVTTLGTNIQAKFQSVSDAVGG